MTSWGLHLGWGQQEAGVEESLKHARGSGSDRVRRPSPTLSRRAPGQTCLQPLLRKPPHSTMSA